MNITSNRFLWYRHSLINQSDINTKITEILVPEIAKARQRHAQVGTINVDFKAFYYGSTYVSLVVAMINQQFIDTKDTMIIIDEIDNAQPK